MKNKIIHLDRDIRWPNVTMAMMYADDGGFGLKLPNGKAGLYTIERPWLNNQQDVSCIPAGNYKAERDMYYGGDGPGGKRDYECFEIRNVPKRSEIKIHIANYIKDIIGCIGPGMARDPNHPAVWSSTQAFNLFMDYMRGIDEFELIIRDI